MCIINGASQNQTVTIGFNKNECSHRFKPINSIKMKGVFASANNNYCPLVCFLFIM